MTTYRVISDANGVPPMTDLEAVYVDEPGLREGGYIVFATNFNPVEAAPYEPAVGVPCSVIRIHDGEERKKRGSVETVAPMLRVFLGGGRWE